MARVPASFFTPPPESPVQMTNSLLLSINATYLSIPAGGLTSNVILGGCGGGERVKKKRGRESGVGVGKRAKEGMEQGPGRRIGGKWPVN